MKSIANQLPPDIARQIHPDRRTNEAAYWAVRDQLLDQYLGEWIGFAAGKVIASGSSPVTVFHAAEATGLHPFFICVGREEEPCRIRRAAFPYDANYAGEALPLIRVEFRKASGSPGVALDRVIPDTGADASVLPWADCQLLQLDPSLGVQGLIRGVAGGSVATLAFQICFDVTLCHIRRRRIVAETAQVCQEGNRRISAEGAQSAMGVPLPRLNILWNLGNPPRP